MGKLISTKQAAKLLGVTPDGLYQLLHRKQVTGPKPMKLGKGSLLLWTPDDIRRVRQELKARKASPRGRHIGGHHNV